MSALIFDVHTLIAAFVLFIWLAVRLITEYLFRIEHQPRTWIHRACFTVYRPSCMFAQSLERKGFRRLSDAVYRFLPLPLARIGYEIWSEQHSEDFEAHLERGKS